MSKKRRTRSQKIIAQLRRELKKQQKPEKKVESKAKIAEKKSEKFLITNYELPITQNLYTYDQSLVKKDLLKTFYLSLIFFFFISILYWYYQAGGQTIIQEFFHL